MVAQRAAPPGRSAVLVERRCPQCTCVERVPVGTLPAGWRLLTEGDRRGGVVETYLCSGTCAIEWIIDSGEWRHRT